MADAKEMWEAIKSRFGGNDESKKMQKYLLKQHFEEIHGDGVSHEDVNRKFLRSLPSSLSQVALIMRTKPGLDTLSFDDLYNNLRVFECDVKGTTASSSSNTQNVTFVSADNTSSTNDINDDDLEEMDLKWQVAVISMRIKKFYKRTCRNIQFDARDTVGFDKTKVECFNCHKIWHFSRDCRAKGNQDSRGRYGGSGSDNEVQSCSKTCAKSYARLKKLYDEQRDKLGDASVEITAYTLALKKVKAQLLCHQQNQLAYEQKIKFIKVDLDDKTDVLTYHKKLLAEALKEKEDLKTKVENWQNSSKNLNRLLNTQMSANDKFGLGYGDYRYGSILSYENEVLQSVFMNKECDLENTLVNDRYAEGMHTVPPPMTGNYMPSGPDVEIDYSKFTYGPKQTSADESDSKPVEYASSDTDSSIEPSTSVPEPVVNESKVVSEPKAVCEPKVWTDAPIIGEYESDSDDDLVFNV
nr:ribonuclease H-like domain-containing protein [Tanacetum cinerariifolium]